MLSQEISAQVIALVFIILVNASSAAILYKEYQRSKRGFIKTIGLAQFCHLMWHFVTIYLVIYPDSNAGRWAVSILVLLVSYFFLAAISSYAHKPLGRTFAFLLTGSLILSSALGPAIGFHPLTAFWLATTIILTITPFYTFQCKDLNSRSIIAALQIILAPSYSIGVAILLELSPDVGGLAYFLISLLIPGISYMFIQESINMSTGEFLEKETLHREIFNSVRDVFCKTDIEGKIIEISASVKQFGFQPDELVGQSVTILFAESSIYEEPMEWLKASAENDIVALDVKTSAGLIRECELTTTPATDSSGRLIGVIGTIRDVTERNQLEYQFLEAQRRESLGVLASGIAHDFNNLLQGIIGRTELLKMTGLENTENNKHHLEVILETSNIAATLCRHLLQYTGKASANLKHVSLESAISDVVEILEPSLSSNIEITVNIQAHDIGVEADLTQIQQVILNLTKNAVDAVEESNRSFGQVTINLCRQTLSQDCLDQSLSFGNKLQGGDYICISVEDNGPGIDPEHINRIFDPFYTTREQGHGLGLSSVSGILRSHHAGIAIESWPDRGSRFSVMLPISKNIDLSEQRNDVQLVHGDGKSILFAEDEGSIRTVTEISLKHQGYDVVCARDGQEAVDLFAAQRTRFSAVVLDIKMPNKTGLEAAKEIRNIDPKIPVILASGNTDTAGHLNSVERNCLVHINKPYKQNQLLFGIQEAIAETVNGSGDNSVDLQARAQQ